jgi:hypothetical protein
MMTKRVSSKQARRRRRRGRKSDWKALSRRERQEERELFPMAYSKSELVSFGSCFSLDCSTKMKTRKMNEKERKKPKEMGRPREKKKKSDVSPFVRVSDVQGECQSHSSGLLHLTLLTFPVY